MVGYFLENPTVDLRKQIMLAKKLISDYPYVIDNEKMLYSLIKLVNMAGVAPVFIFGMNRSQRLFEPAVYTVLMLIPTPNGIVKFAPRIPEWGYNSKSWGYSANDYPDIKDRIKEFLKRYDLKAHMIDIYGKYY